jgi:hypothetical protein
VKAHSSTEVKRAQFGDPAEEDQRDAPHGNRVSPGDEGVKEFVDDYRGEEKGGREVRDELEAQARKVARLRPLGVVKG